MLNRTPQLQILLFFVMFLNCSMSATASNETYGTLTLKDGSNWKNDSTISPQDKEKLNELQIHLDQIYADIKVLVLWNKNSHSKSADNRKSVRDRMILNIDRTRVLITRFTVLNLQLKNTGKKNRPLNAFGESLLFPRNEMFRLDGSLVYDGSRLTARKEVDLFVQGSTDSLRGVDGKAESSFHQKQ